MPNKNPTIEELRVKLANFRNNDSELQESVEV